MSTVKHDTENSNTRQVVREVVQSPALPRSAYFGVRADRPSHSHYERPQVPGTELRQFFGERARKLADEVEQGRPVEPRELMLLVETAREIIAISKAAL